MDRPAPDHEERAERGSDDRHRDATDRPISARSATGEERSRSIAATICDAAHSSTDPSVQSRSATQRPRGWKR